MKRDNKGFSLLELLIVVAIILIIATIAIPSLLRSRQAANESAAVAQLRTVNTAQVTYLSSSGGYYGTLAQLVSSGLLDSRFSATPALVSGYTFTVSTDGNYYSAFASPASANTGRYGYYSLADAVVRYSTVTGLFPAGKDGAPVQ